MPLSNFPQAEIRFEVQVYQRPSDEKRLRDTHIAFSGAPQKHPTNPEKIILVVDPCSDNTFYYEFAKNDISYVEELPSLVDMDGTTLTMIRMWVRKGSIAVRCTPFIAGDTLPND